MFVFTGSRASVFVLDSVESRRELHREREIRIRRGIGNPKLAARAKSATIRNADHRRPVAHRPRDVHRRLVSRHEPLVRVHERIRDRAESARVIAAARRCNAARSARAPTCAFGSQNAFSFPRNSDWCVCMPLPFCPNTGFGMNDAIRPNCCATCRHDEPERRDVVGGLQRVRIPEIDFVLAVRDFMVRGFDLESHLLEHVHDRPPRIFAEIHRREIEVRADVVRRPSSPRPSAPSLNMKNSASMPAFIVLNPSSLAAIELATQHARGSPSNGSPSGVVDVADQSRRRGSPDHPTEIPETSRGPERAACRTPRFARSLRSKSRRT